jgi:hypothetical protein
MLQRWRGPSLPDRAPLEQARRAKPPVRMVARWRRARPELERIAGGLRSDQLSPLIPYRSEVEAAAGDSG